MALSPKSRAHDDGPDAVEGGVWRVNHKSKESTGPIRVYAHKPNQNDIKNKTMNIKLFNEDNLEVMKGLSDESIDVICIDPPYLYLKPKTRASF